MTTTQLTNQARAQLLSVDLVSRNESNYAWQAACSAFLALPGLRAFWPMSSVDYTVASRARDVAGGAYHLTDVNTVAFGYDQLTPYVQLVRANSEYLSRADGGATNWADITGGEAYVLAADQGLTVGGWFYFDSLPVANSPGIISKWVGASNDRSYVLIYNTATSTVLGALSNTGAATAVSQSHTTTIAVDTWYYIVLRFVPSTSMDIWVQDIKVTNAVGVPATLFDSAVAFEIGRWEANNSRTFDGRASLCFLCASALSDSIISALYHQTRKLYNV